MRPSQVVRAADCQCRSRNSPGFDPSILRHSGIWGVADEAVLNTVHIKEKIQKSPCNSRNNNARIAKCKNMCTCLETSAMPRSLSDVSELALRGTDRWPSSDAQCRGSWDRIRIFFAELLFAAVVDSSSVTDPVPFWPLDPGWVKIRIRIRDEQPGSYFRELRNHIFRLKYLYSLIQIRDPNSGMEKIRIRDKHPGSATLDISHENL